MPRSGDGNLTSLLVVCPRLTSRATTPAMSVTAAWVRKYGRTLESAKRSQAMPPSTSPATMPKTPKATRPNPAEWSAENVMTRASPAAGTALAIGIGQ